MRNWIAGVARVGPTARFVLVGAAVIGVGAAVLAPGISAAETREFVGSVVKINATKVVVENRMRDKMDFIHSDSTVVEGRRSRWKDIEAKDRVSVTWDVGDKPRRAHRIKVMAPEKSSGDE